MPEATDPQSEIHALRDQLAQIAARLAELEQREAAQTAGSGEARGPVRPTPAPEPLPDEIVAVIAAAVAAFLGKRVRVRQIRLITSPGWAQQGRVSIQASHRLDR